MAFAFAEPPRTPHPQPFFGSNRSTGAIGGCATVSKSLKGRGGLKSRYIHGVPLLPLREKVAGAKRRSDEECAIFTKVAGFGELHP